MPDLNLGPHDYSALSVPVTQATSSSLAIQPHKSGFFRHLPRQLSADLPAVHGRQYMFSWRGTLAKVMP